MGKSTEKSAEKSTEKSAEKSADRSDNQNIIEEIANGKEHYSYEDFLEVIKYLRSKDGCPWDREQTHMSLRPCMMEEAAEVLAGIRIYDQTGNYENLREELGDVLLQVVMHATIAEEEGIFTMEDVVNEVAEKMVRRHPHIFGTVQADTSEQALSNWEDIKRKEKEGKTQVASPLREIPEELPALTRGMKVLKKVDKLYESMPDYTDAVASLREAAEKLSALTPAAYDLQITELVGDTLVAVDNLSRICKLAPEQILADRVEGIIEKYEDRITENDETL